MAKLKEIWIEHHAKQNPAIRIDWDNDRHQRIEIKGRNPLHILEALEGAHREITVELGNEKI